MSLGQLLSQGLTFGAIFATVALGYHLIYETTGILNFALGEQLAIAGLIALSFTNVGLPLPVAVVSAVVVGTLVGVVAERLALTPAKRMGPVGPIIASIGVALVLIHGRNLVWGPNPRDFPPFSGAPNESVAFLDGQWLLQSFWIIGLVALLTAALLWFLRRSAWGRAWRATAQSPLGARLSGIRPAFVSAGSVGLASGMVTLTGITVAPVVLAGGFFGLDFGVKGFAAAIVGGFHSTLGVIVGGLLVGLLDSYLVGAFSDEWADMVLFGLLIVALLVRPHGLFGQAAVDRA